MRHLLIIAFVISLAFPLDAQERVLLQMDTTTYGPAQNWIGGSDGENGSGVLQRGQRPALAYMMWHLPAVTRERAKPDSIEFVFRSNTPVQLWTLIESAKWYCRLSVEEPSESFIRVTVPFETCREESIVYAGTGLAGRDLRTPDSTGFIEVDAVYAVWAAPKDTSTASVGEEFSESFSRAYAKSHFCKWRDEAGRVIFIGTSEDLALEAPACVLFGPYQMIWSGSRLAWKRAEVLVKGAAR